MHDLPRRTLCKLIIQHGPALHADPKRTEAFLRDLCGDHIREIFVLVNAQKQRIPADLLAAPAWMPQQVLQAQLIRRLEENLALTHEAAEWAVVTWAEALRVGPNPPDRIWVWLRQHTPRTLPTVHSKQIFDKSGALGRRLFSWFVVQWVVLSPLLCYWGTLVLNLCRWMWRQRERLSHPFVLVPLVLLFCVSIALASINPTRPPTSTASLMARLLAAYPLPRTASVGTSVLMVRDGPSTAAQVLGTLTDGQEVTVVDFSMQGAWSQIETPFSGWVSNEFLRFHLDGEPTLAARLVLAEGSVIGEHVNVRRGPGTEYDVVETLMAGQAVVIVAAMPDGGWWHIVAPVHGWVSVELVQPNGMIEN